MMSDSRLKPDEGPAKPETRFKPKPENDEDIRMYAAVSFAVLLIAVGVPLWWKTTEVYRVHVPYGHIAELQDKVLSFNININFYSPRDSIYNLEENVFKTLTGPFQIKLIHKQVNNSNEIAVDSLLALDKLPYFQSEKPGELVFLEVPNLSDFTHAHIVVGTRRTVYFSPEASDYLLAEVLCDWLLQGKSLNHTLQSMQLPLPLDLEDSTARRRVPPSVEYDLMLTVVHPEPDRRIIAWNLQSAVEDQLSTMLSSLLPVSKLRVKSQWLYLTKLEIRPKQMVDESGVWYALSQEALPHIITPLEKKLGTSVSSNPSIQLVLYIPPCNWSPLHIVRSYASATIRPKDSENAFLSPRWGGIQFYNPPVNTCSDSLQLENVHIPNSALVMSVFRKQLKLLLGVHPLDEKDRVEQLPLPPSSLRLWECDILLRTRTLEQITSAKLTLKVNYAQDATAKLEKISLGKKLIGFIPRTNSLAQLLEEMNNIVITAEVGECIWEAIRSVTAATESLYADDLLSAFNSSQRAFINAETAFTDPSLLALLYFPEDQKYAVYIPLFLPIMIPVLMSLRSIFTWLLRGKKKQKKD